MKTPRYGLFSFFAIVLFLLSSPAFAGHGAGGGPPKAVIEGGDTINVSGIVLDSHKEPINEAAVRVFVNGKEVERTFCNRDLAFFQYSENCDTSKVLK